MSSVGQIYKFALQNLLNLLDHRFLRRTIPWLTLARDTFRFDQRDAFGNRRNRVGARRADVILARAPPIAQRDEHLPPFFAAFEAVGDDGAQWRCDVATPQHLIEQKAVVAQGVDERVLVVVECGIKAVAPFGDAPIPRNVALYQTRLCKVFVVLLLAKHCFELHYVFKDSIKIPPKQ